MTYDTTTSVLQIAGQTAADRDILLNDYMSIKSLNLGVSVNTNSSEVIAASLEAEMDVKFGSDDSTTGHVVIQLEDGAMTLDASLMIQASVELGPLLLTGGSFQVNLRQETGANATNATKALSLTVSATANVTYSADSDPIVLAIAGTYNSSSNEISIIGTSEPMIPSVFGLDVLSVGKLGIAPQSAAASEPCGVQSFRPRLLEGKSRT